MIAAVPSRKGRHCRRKRDSFELDGVKPDKHNFSMSFSRFEPKTLAVVYNFWWCAILNVLFNLIFFLIRGAK
jgi:hypothetical protein